MTAGVMFVRSLTAGQYRPVRLGEVRLYHAEQPSGSRQTRPPRNMNIRIGFGAKQIGEVDLRISRSCDTQSLRVDRLPTALG